VTTCVMHCLAMKFRTMVPRTCAARRQRPVVTLAIVEVMIDVPVKMLRPMEPRSGPYEKAAREPLRTVIPVRRAVIRGRFVVAIRTNRRYSNVDRYLSICLMRRDQQKTRSGGH